MMSNSSHIAVLMITARPVAERRAIIASARSAGIDALRFVDAVDSTNPSDDGGCLSSLDFNVLECPIWRKLAMKKVAQTCSYMRLLDEVTRLGTPALALEDDVVFRPSNADFASLFPRLIAHLVQTKSNWDLVHLGPCLERPEKIRSCHFIGAPSWPLWISPSFQPACLHAVIIGVSAAIKLRELWLHFRTEYMRRTTNIVQAPADCLTRANAIKWNATLRRSLRSLYSGKDQVMRKAIESGLFRSYDVWPMLAEQVGRLSDPLFSLSHRKPSVCRGKASWRKYYA